MATESVVVDVAPPNKEQEFTTYLNNMDPEKKALLLSQLCERNGMVVNPNATNASSSSTTTTTSTTTKRAGKVTSEEERRNTFLNNHLAPMLRGLVRVAHEVAEQNVEEISQSKLATNPTVRAQNKYAAYRLELANFVNQEFMPRIVDLFKINDTELIAMTKKMTEKAKKSSSAKDGDNTTTTTAAGTTTPAAKKRKRTTADDKQKPKQKTQTKPKRAFKEEEAIADEDEEVEEEQDKQIKKKSNAIEEVDEDTNTAEGNYEDDDEEEEQDGEEEAEEEEEEEEVPRPKKKRARTSTPRNPKKPTANSVKKLAAPTSVQLKNMETLPRKRGGSNSSNTPATTSKSTPLTINTPIKGAASVIGGSQPAKRL